MSDKYYSIKSPAQTEFKEKGSKFLSFAFPVASEEEIKQRLKELKDDYWDASHHCYAYVLGPKGDIFRANDAGEPNHSAGDPILSQIRSFQLTGVLIVVVRYFGGTKLGVSGLISAYKTAAKQAIEVCEVVEKFVMREYKVTFGFEQMSWVMKNIKTFEAEVLEQNFIADSVKTQINLIVREGLAEAFLKSLQGAQGIEITSSS